AVAVDEPVVVFPLQQADGGAELALELQEISGRVFEGAADGFDVLNPGGGIGMAAQEGGGIDQELMIEGGMGDVRGGDTDDFCGQGVAHPGGAVDEHDLWREAREGDFFDYVIAGAEIAVDAGADEGQEDDAFE